MDFPYGPKPYVYANSTTSALTTVRGLFVLKRTALEGRYILCICETW